MALWFLRGVWRGVVTTRYPATPPDPWLRTLHGPPTFRPTLLTTELADELADVCPNGALRRDGTTLIYDVGRCTACGRCVARAGEATAPGHEHELAATDRRQLLKRIPILGDGA